MHQIGCLSQSDSHLELAVFCATCSHDQTRAATSGLSRLLEIDKFCQSDSTTGKDMALRNLRKRHWGKA